MQKITSKKLQINQILCYQICNSEGKIKEVTVCEIKNKYFKVKEFPKEKFYISNLKQVTKNNEIGLQLYLTKKDIINNKSKNQLESELCYFFWQLGRAFPDVHLSIEKLKKIYEVIKL